MTSKKWQFIAVVSPLLLVEFNAFWKLAGWLSWGYEGALSITTAIAFISLMLGSIVALGQDIPPSIRRNIRLAGVLLFLVQGIANVLLTYEYARVHLPAEVPMELLGIDRDTALKATAILQGSVLSVVSISIWQVIAEMLNQHLHGIKQRQSALKEISEMLDGDGSRV